MFGHRFESGRLHLRRAHLSKSESFLLRWALSLESLVKASVDAVHFFANWDLEFSNIASHLDVVLIIKQVNTLYQCLKSHVWLIYILYFSIMWAVYILRCSDGKIYVGSTGNLQQRMASHSN